MINSPQLLQWALRLGYQSVHDDIEAFISNGVFREAMCQREGAMDRHTNAFHKVTNLLNVCQFVIVCNNISNNLTLFHTQIVSIKPGKHTEP